MIILSSYIASFLTLMRTSFMEKEQWTLNELFEILSKNSNLELSENVMKHRIRSGVYSLKKNGEIIRVGDSTYKRNHIRI